VALGGDDTLGVAAKLWKDGFPTVGVPKTMDNDLNNTDYTFGFDTAVAADVEAVDRLRDTAKSHSRVIVLEVMGRDAGWVALNTAIAGGADWVLVPETTPDLDAMCAHLKARRAGGKNYGIVVVSEGIHLPQLEGAEKKVDAFGNVLHSGVGKGETVAKYIEEKTGFETRGAVMGHIQRGGSPTAYDRVLGTRVGIRAAQCVHEKDFGKMVALQGTEVVAVPIESAVGTLRTVPAERFAEVKCLFDK
jgi:6-phosphofructokinase 1